MSLPLHARVEIATLLRAPNAFIGKELFVGGWIRSARKQKQVAFISLGDGSSPAALQLVLDPTLPSFAQISDKITTGASIFAKGTLIQSPGKGQNVELQVSSLTLLVECPEEFPLQKKEHSPEFLREIAHLRLRTRLHLSIQRIRSELAQQTHFFFKERGFVYANTPIITASDCEGAGELFQVTTLNLEEKLSKSPDGKVDYSKDFFEKKSYLTVSGQLNGEAMAMGLGKIYTFGPTFRAENSNTSRHLAEFWMIEPEVAFADLEMNMELAESYVKHLIQAVLSNCKQEIAFLEESQDPGLTARLTHLVESPFAKATYSEAIEILAKAPVTFEFPHTWGSDLQSEHERYLAEKHFKAPLFLYNYPRSIKAFYMRDNDDGKTVAAMDLLVPGIGELIGGSQREERLDKLSAKIIEWGLDLEPYAWYLDSRRFGSVPHAGFGLGFERMVQFVTGTENIRDVIPFPRTPKHAEF